MVSNLLDIENRVAVLNQRLDIALMYFRPDDSNPSLPAVVGRILDGEGGGSPHLEGSSQKPLRQRRQEYTGITGELCLCLTTVLERLFLLFDMHLPEKRRDDVADLQVAAIAGTVKIRRYR